MFYKLKNRLFVTTVTTLLFIYSIPIFGQQLDLSFDSLLVKLRKAPPIIKEGHFSNHFGCNETYQNAKLLESLCSTDMLFGLLADTSRVVRYYMFMELLYRKIDLETLEEIVKQHQNDSALIYLMSVDVIVPWKMNEYMEALLERYKADSDFILKKDADFANQKKGVVDVLFPSNCNNVRKDDLLKMDSLACTQDDFVIISFVLSIFYKQGNFRIEVHDNKLGFEIKNAIKNAVEGDVIYLEEIRIRNGEGMIRKIPSKVFKVL